MEHGLVEAHGNARNRTYTLSAKVYDSLGEKSQYVRQRGFDKIQQEQMVLQFLDEHGRITRQQIAELCRISLGQASYLIKKMREKKLLKKRGKSTGRSVYYVRQ